MFRKFIKKINSLFRIRFCFDLPNKNKILLYDEVHSSILKEIIKRDFNILELRNKKIYFWIYIKQIIFFDFSFRTYSINYIRYTSPKVIITFNDARFQMYQLKQYFRNIPFISIMNGLRFEKWFKDNKKLWPNITKQSNVDYFFTLNKFYIPKYQKILKSNYRVLGHFRNNSVKIKKTKYKNKFLYLSQLHDSPNIVGIDYEHEKYRKKLLNFINLYLSRSNKKLHILLRRSKDNPRQKLEIDFYKKIFNSNCVFHQSLEWKKKYQIMDKFENVIFSFSTMGYEAISRKKKIAIFAPTKINGSKFYFGWPGIFKKKYNFFSSQNLSYKEVKRVLDNINNCTQSNWNKEYYNTIKDQFHFDKNNEKLKNLVLKLIKI